LKNPNENALIEIYKIYASDKKILRCYESEKITKKYIAVAKNSFSVQKLFAQYKFKIYSK